MAHADGSAKVDELLLPFLHAAPDEENEALERLVAALRPSIEAVIRRRVGGRVGIRMESANESDARDLSQDAVLVLLRKLRSLKADPNAAAIGDVRAYVARLAQTEFGQLLRKRHPKRWSLQGKLRYVAQMGVGVEIWEHLGEMVIGLKPMRGRPFSQEKLRRFLESPVGFVGTAVEPSNPSDLPLAELLARVLAALEGPAPFDSMVFALAVALGLNESESVSDAGSEPLAELAGTGVPVDVAVETREMLSLLWDEVVQLPVRQRCAVLLNLRDHRGRGVIELLPLVGIAGFDDIARALEMSYLELAELLSDLPIEDSVIAARMGLTPGEVGNLRAVGRARLKRRLAKANYG